MNDGNYDSLPSCQATSGGDVDMSYAGYSGVCYRQPPYEPPKLIVRPFTAACGSGYARTTSFVALRDF